MPRFFIFQVSKFIPFRFSYSSFAKVDLQFPNNYDISQLWNLILDDVNLGWMRIKNGLTGLYLRCPSENEVIVDGK